MPTVFDGLSQMAGLPDAPMPFVGASAPFVGAAGPFAGAAGPGLRGAAPVRPIETLGGIAIEAGRYFRLVTIDVRHGFYPGPDAPCPDIEIAATPETDRRLRMFGLIPRTRPGGLDLLWDARVFGQAESICRALHDHFAPEGPAAVAAAFENIRETYFFLPLLFTVRVSNPLFPNFTKGMPTSFPIGDPPLSLTTLGLALGEGREAEIALDWDNVIQRPPDRPIQALRPVPRPGTEAAAAAASEAEADAVEETTADFPKAGDGPAVAERMHLLRRSRDFALLDLHLARPPGVAAPADGGWDGLPIDLDARGGFADDEPVYFRPCAYTLSFEARETRWRYVVAPRGIAVDDQSLEVVDEDGAPAGFAFEGRRTLPNGLDAVCLARAEALGLRAIQDKPFALTGVLSGGRAQRRTLVERLPPAGIDSITPEPAATAGSPPAGQPPPAWSDIYVFL